MPVMLDDALELLARDKITPESAVNALVSEGYERFGDTIRASSGRSAEHDLRRMSPVSAKPKAVDLSSHQSLRPGSYLASLAARSARKA